MDRGYSRRGKSRAWQRLLVILLLFAVAILIPGFFILTGLKEVSRHGKALTAAYNNQNFEGLKAEITATKFALQKVNLPLNLLFWMRIIPFVGGYYSDAQKFASAGMEEAVAVETIFSSFNAQDVGFRGQPISGTDRMTQAIKILEKSLPGLDKVTSNLKKAADEVKDINTNKYPKSFRGIDLRRSLQTAKNFIIGVNIAAAAGKSALTIAPSALGTPTAKNYLLLFQNDKEIRPTGGFITAYATLKIENGQVQSTTSDDIYRLDERLLATCLSKICPLAPPAPIIKYLPEVSGKARSAWSMRDSNISPDVPTSAREFERMYQLLGGGLPFDGIIYIDSQVVEELIEVTGPIDVFGTKYSAQEDKRCNCPNVIYELESYAEIAAKGEQDRKAILGVLMQQILARAVGSEIEKLPILLETLVRLSNHKHIMFFMHDASTQKALAALNWTGEIKDYNGDYLHINDSNFAGGKSNLYVEQTVTQEINPQKDGTVRKKITIEYKNSQPFGVWLNGINRDYVRFYVPKGSKLISSKGSEDTVNTIEDLDKTVFEAFIQVRPANLRKLEVEYVVPYNPGKEYKLLIQKQPGAKDFHYRVIFNDKIKLNGKQMADFNLEQDREFKFSL